MHMFMIQVLPTGRGFPSAECINHQPIRHTRGPAKHAKHIRGINTTTKPNHVEDVRATRYRYHFYTHPTPLTMDPYSPEGGTVVPALSRQTCHSLNPKSS
jgi:hypothetical protein